jgi:hypothetical protein
MALQMQTEVKVSFSLPPNSAPNSDVDDEDENGDDIKEEPEATTTTATAKEEEGFPK